MADRYQDRPFPADDHDRGGRQNSSPKSEADPLAELARLIGQNDPFSNFGRGKAKAPPRAAAAEPYRPAPAQTADDEDIELGPPPAWMQSRASDTSPRQEPLSARHPLRPAAPAAIAAPYEESYPEALPYPPEDAPMHGDPGRYDDALYGQIEPVHGMADPSHGGVYPEPPYDYEDGYAEQPELKPRRTGMATIAAVLALAVVGTGGAFAYRTYMGSPRSGEAPVIRADPGPTKVLPPDSAGKPIQDRLAAANGAEALVSREEQPVDPSKAGPRMVLPPMAQNANSPFPAPPGRLASPPATTNATGDEPRKIRTLSVRPDQADAAAAPVARPAPAARAPATTATTRAPSPPVANANASAPLSLSPQDQSADARTRVATAPTALPPSAAGGGNYVVQVSSQRSEADAKSSYKALQGKFPSVLGSRSALIKRADLGDKGVYYRAMVGPFGSPDEASAFCGNLKSAGGQCVVQRN